MKIVKYLFLLSLLGRSFLPAEEGTLRTDTRKWTSFESEADIANLRFKSASAKRVKAGVSEGEYALKLRFEPTDAYPSVNFVQPEPVDLRGYGGIAFDVYNPTDATVAFGIRIDSSTRADGKGNHSRGGGGSISPGRQATFVIPFGVNPAELGMKSLPGYGAYRSTGANGRGPFDLGTIVTWQIFLNRPYSPAELIIDHVRLVPGREQDFTGMIDRYGQYAFTQWPGKIESDADFTEQRLAEDRDLEAHPAVAGRTQYGGWAEGPLLEATGFFRVEKVRGKWTFVDPEGRLFLSVGPTTVGAGSSTLLTGREPLFGDHPTEDPFLRRYTKGEENRRIIDYFAANLERKYGADFRTRWFERSYTRFVSWGFNTIGAFSSWETLSNGKIPYTATVWVGGDFARIRTGSEQVRAMPDPFDPEFAASVDRAVRPQAQRIQDDPWFLGYFVGNEEHWGYHHAGPRSHYTLVLTALRMSAETSPAKQAFLKRLREEHGSIDALNVAWNTSFTDWEALREPLTFSTPYSPALLEDFSRLLTLYAEHYFRVVQAGLKKYSPNHLYLGCRFAGYSPEVLAAAATYSDVFSFNLYRLTLEPEEFAFLEAYDMPVLVGEFHFGAPDRGVWDTGLLGVVDQEARGTAYQNYLKSVLALPNFVGAHWFQYTDQPATGRPMDGENGNLGFISITDTPYPELIDAAREIHTDIYRIRFGD